MIFSVATDILIDLFRLKNRPLLVSLMEKITFPEINRIPFDVCSFSAIFHILIDC